MYPLEFRHLICSSERLRLVTLGVCRHLDGVKASWFGDLLKEGCEKTRAFVSGLVLAISGVEEEQPRVNRGVGSCWNQSKWLDLPQRCLA